MKQSGPTAAAFEYHFNDVSNFEIIVSKFELFASNFEIPPGWQSVLLVDGGRLEDREKHHVHVRDGQAVELLGVSEQSVRNSDNRLFRVSNRLFRFSSYMMRL